MQQIDTQNGDRLLTRNGIATPQPSRARQQAVVRLTIRHRNPGKAAFSSVVIVGQAVSSAGDRHPVEPPLIQQSQYQVFSPLSKAPN
jgi:hypothetical protein